MLKPRASAAGRRRPRGLSIVELMVGIAIGLFVVAAASMLVSTQLSDNRRLTLETQVQQDLRATADIITRELRRAGHWGTARQSVGAPANINPYVAVAKAEDGSAFADRDVSSVVLLSYSRSGNEADENGAIDSAERLGFRLSNGVVQTQLGKNPMEPGNWQALTDANTLNVTALDFTMRVQPIRLECAKPCPGPGDCRPILEVRNLEVRIRGEAAHDSSVRRSLQSNVRLRNDALVAGTCPA
ncbi:MAG TPA: prepilin-type N-terminal cleavage/methylation domain-containing protein [Rubrivivax sp.]|nr:prepilin-type N-terminal cleavage/methylation domain-containing protein [Rubrivivax sp.]